VQHLWNLGNYGKERAINAVVSTLEALGPDALQMLQKALPDLYSAHILLINNAAAAIDTLKRSPNTREVRDAKSAITTALISPKVTDLRLGAAVMRLLNIDHEQLATARENRAKIDEGDKKASWLAPNRYVQYNTGRTCVHALL